MVLKPSVRHVLPLLAVVLSVVLSACSTVPPVSPVSPMSPVSSGIAKHERVASLRLIGEQRIPLNHAFKGTTVGGLSGIDYDPTTNTWVAESDDRSEINPARFYRLRLHYDLSGFHKVELADVHFFRQADGSNYPGPKEFSERGGEVPDIESIRVDPLDGSIWYASEGVRRFGLGPFVKQARRDGSYLATFPTGAHFKIDTTRQWGPRDNLAFEGLSFSPDGRYLWLGMEAPLYQDGELPTTKAGALVRISKYERSGEMLAQYAYPVDAIVKEPAGRYADNGLSEILAVDEHRLLVLERSGVQDKEGIFHFYIRIYEMDVSQASDIKSLDSLAGAKFIAAKKRLILNLNETDLTKVDNLEGMAWGPKLANGHDSLVLISDDNFHPSQVTQLLVFEVLPF